MSNRVKRILLFLLLIPCWVIAYRYDIDLVVLHHTAVLSHSDLLKVYDYNGMLGRFFYGPITLVLIYPLGFFSYDIVKFVWIGLQTISFVLFWMLLSQLYPALKERPLRWAWIVVWIVSINPIHNNFQSNNIQLMLATTLLAAEWLSRKSSVVAKWGAGILCVCCGMIKVFPLFLAAYYVVSKPREVKQGIFAGLLLSALVPILFFGPNPAMHLFQEFFRNLTTYAAENSLTKVPDILCLPSLLSRAFGDSAFANVVSKSILGSIAGLYLFFAWRCKPTSIDQQNQWWALALFLMAFLNPSTRPHYFIFYVPAFCSALEYLCKQTFSYSLGISLAAATLLIAFTAEGVVGKHWNNQLEFLSVPTYGMLILGFVLAFVILRTIQAKKSQLT